MFYFLTWVIAQMCSFFDNSLSLWYVPFGYVSHTLKEKFLKIKNKTQLKSQELAQKNQEAKTCSI